MTPLGNCPGCGTDEPFVQVHPDQCPDVDGQCPEWACAACGAGMIMGTVPGAPGRVESTAGEAPAAVPAGPSARAA
jgi:hypothetical protein